MSLFLEHIVIISFQLYLCTLKVYMILLSWNVDILNLMSYAEITTFILFPLTCNYILTCKLIFINFLNLVFDSIWFEALKLVFFSPPHSLGVI